MFLRFPASVIFIAIAAIPFYFAPRPIWHEREVKTMETNGFTDRLMADAARPFQSEQFLILDFHNRLILADPIPGAWCGNSILEKAEADAMANPKRVIFQLPPAAPITEVKVHVEWASGWRTK
jgi:hypothetical protein